MFAGGGAFFFVLGKGELGEARAHSAADFDEPPRLEVAQEIIKHLRIATPVAGVVVKKTVLFLGGFARDGEQFVVEIEGVELGEHRGVVPLDARQLARFFQRTREVGGIHQRLVIMVTHGEHPRFAKNPTRHAKPLHPGHPDGPEQQRPRQRERQQQHIRHRQQRLHATAQTAAGRKQVEQKIAHAPPHRSNRQRAPQAAQLRRG